MTPQDDESKRANMAILLRELEAQMSTPAYAEQNRIVAKNFFDRYQSFVNAGFSPDQAMLLLTKS